MRTRRLITIILCLAACCSASADTLSRVYIAPQDVGLVMGAAQAFTVIGEDACGNPVDVPQPITWSVTAAAGTTNQDGVFTAGSTPGRYWDAVTASVPGGYIAKANVDVYSNEPKSGWTVERGLGSLTGDVLSSPIAVEVSGGGDIYVLDQSTSSIYVFAPSFRLLFSFALHDPVTGRTAMSIAPNGNVYVLNAPLYRVQIYDSGGAFIREWGVQGSGIGQFVQPDDVAVGPDGRVFIADSGKDLVSIFDSSDMCVGENPLIGFSAIGPMRVAVDRRGYMYLSAYSGWEGEAIAVFDSSGSYLSRATIYDPSRDIACLNGDVFVLQDVTIKRYGPSDFGTWFYYGYKNKWGSGGWLPGSFDSPSGLAVDSLGRVYVADTDNSRVQVFDAAGALLKSTSSFRDDLGQFNLPSGAAVDSQGHLFVADSGNRRVQEFGPDGAAIREISSSCNRDSVFSCPGGVTINPAGDLRIADAIWNRVLTYDSDGALLFNWPIPLGGQSIDSVSPAGIVCDPAGNTYVVDASFNWINKFDSSGNPTAVFGSGGSGNGQFATPFGIARNSSAQLLVTDYGNNRVQKLSSAGVYVSKWGSAGTGNGQFQGPAGICVDTGSNAYVVDQGNCRVQKFSSAGGYVSKLGSRGSGKFQFSDPVGVGIDAQGRIYVADTHNHRIMQYAPYQTGLISVSITSPTSADTYTSSAASIAISGTASGSITGVTWRSDRGGSGACTGLTTWSALSIPLFAGENVVSVTAVDMLGNTMTDSLVVTCTVLQSPPSISIVDHGLNPTRQFLNVSGNASDTAGIDRVEWRTDRGSAGVCTGTTSWNAAAIPMGAGENLVTLTAVSTSGHTASDHIAIWIEDNPPTIQISQPTSRSTWITRDSDLAVSGTAADDRALERVYLRRGSQSMGTCTGTTNWSGSIPLVVGSQSVSAVARDIVGHETSASFQVRRTNLTPISIAAAKALPNNTSVYLTGKVVSAAFGGFVTYVQEPDSPSGIRLLSSVQPGELQVGDTIDVIGAMYTSNGERYLGGCFISVVDE